MVKVVLREDGHACSENAAGVTVVLDGDGSAVPAYLQGDVEAIVGDRTTVSVTAEVRQREFNGYDDDGNPVFVWSVVVSGEVVAWHTSMEVDEFTSVSTGTVTVLYDGDATVTEGAVVVDSGGLHWDVVSVKCPAGRLELGIRRVEGTNVES